MSEKWPIQARRRFGGKEYIYTGQYTTKKEAQAVAKKTRERGNLARVVPVIVAYGRGGRPDYWYQVWEWHSTRRFKVQERRRGTRMWKGCYIISFGWSAPRAEAEAYKRKMEARQGHKFIYRIIEVEGRK